MYIKQSPSITHHTFIASSVTTVKPHLKSLGNTLHNSRSPIGKSCKEGEFKCESDGVCIVGYKVCNYYNDCSDKSDEKYCEFDSDDYSGNALYHFSHTFQNLIFF